MAFDPPDDSWIDEKDWDGPKRTAHRASMRQQAEAHLKWIRATVLARDRWRTIAIGLALLVGVLLYQLAICK